MFENEFDDQFGNKGHDCEQNSALVDKQGLTRSECYNKVGEILLILNTKINKGETIFS